MPSPIPIKPRKINTARQPKMGPKNAAINIPNPTPKGIPK